MTGYLGLAALLIAGTHFALPGFANAGMTGMSMFFVIVGFSATRQLETMSLGGFYRYWASRLFPVLLLVIAVFGLYDLLNGGDAIKNGLATLFGVGNLFRAAGEDIGHLSHAWPFAIQMQYLVALPVLVWVARKTNRPVLLLLGLAGWVIAWRAVTPLADFAGEPYWGRVYFGTDTRLDALLLGSAAAFLPLRPNRFLAFGSLAILGAFSVVVFPQALSLTVAGIASVGLLLGPFSVPALDWLGHRFVAIYLWHTPINWILGDDPVVTAALSLIAVVVSYELERRFLDDDAPALHLVGGHGDVGVPYLNIDASADGVVHVVGPHALIRNAHPAPSTRIDAREGRLGGPGVGVGVVDPEGGLRLVDRVRPAAREYPHIPGRTPA